MSNFKDQIKQAFKEGRDKVKKTDKPFLVMAFIALSGIVAIAVSSCKTGDKEVTPKQTAAELAQPHSSNTHRSPRPSRSSNDYSTTSTYNDTDKDITVKGDEGDTVVPPSIQEQDPPEHRWSKGVLKATKQPFNVLTQKDYRFVVACKDDKGAYPTWTSTKASDDYEYPVAIVRGKDVYPIKAIRLNGEIISVPKLDNGKVDEEGMGALYGALTNNAGNRIEVLTSGKQRLGFDLPNGQMYCR